MPSGSRKQWVRLHFGTSAAVLPLVKKEIVLTREYRHGLGKIAFSLPGGTAEDGEMQGNRVDQVPNPHAFSISGDGINFARSG